MVIVECRKTKAGASTFVKKMRKNQNLSISTSDMSKSGNHWQEVVDGPDGEMFYVVDKSNSGKHNCWIGIMDSTKEDGYRTYFKNDGGPCRICGCAI